MNHFGKLSRKAGGQILTGFFSNMFSSGDKHDEQQQTQGIQKELSKRRVTNVGAKFNRLVNKNVRIFIPTSQRSSQNLFFYEVVALHRRRLSYNCGQVLRMLFKLNSLLI